MRSRPLRTVLAGVALVVGCGDDAPRDAPPSGPPDRFHVAGGFLRDPEGRTTFVRGMNVANAHKGPPYFGFHGPEDLARLRDEWGMNGLRLLVSWAGLEPEKGSYDEAYLDAIAERITWARDAELLVVVDIHQDLYGEGFGGDGAPRWTCDESYYAAFVPQEPWFLGYLDPNMGACYDHFWQSAELRAHYIEAARRLAARLEGMDDVVVGLDPMNEPYWGTASLLSFEAETLQPFYEALIPAVRAERPEWVAFLEPAASRNLGTPTGLAPLPFADVVYSPHSYDRAAESGMGFSVELRAEVLQNFADLRLEADALGAALWIGEYGGTTGSPGIAEYMDAEQDGAGGVLAGSTYWSYDADDGYGFLDAAGQVKDVLVSALLRPFPERVAGEVVSLSWDDANVMTLVYRPNRAIEAPTTILVPGLLSDGPTVECDDCVVSASRGGVYLDAPGDVVTVRVAP